MKSSDSPDDAPPSSADEFSQISRVVPLSVGKLYGVVIAVTVITLVLHLVLAQFDGSNSFLLLYLFPVSLSAYLGGLRPGVGSVVCTFLGYRLLVLAGISGLPLGNHVNPLEWVIWASLGVTLSLAFHHLRDTRHRAEAHADWQQETLEGLGEAVIRLDVAGQIMSLNAAAQRLLGWSAKDALGQLWSSVIRCSPAPESAVSERTAELSVTPNLPAVVGQTQVQTRQGDWLEVESQCLPLTQANGAAAGAVVVLRESFATQPLSEAMLTAAALIEQLGAIMNSAQGVIGIYRLRPDGVVCFPFVSPAVEAIFGVPAEVLRDDASIIFERIHPDDLPLVKTSTEESRQNLQPWRAEFRVNHPDKGLIWIEGASVPQVEGDGSILWYGFLHDITRQKQVAEVSHQNQVLLAQVERLAHFGAWTVEYPEHEPRDDNPLHWSDGVFRIFGYEPGAVVPSNALFLSHVHPDDRALIPAEVQRALTEGGSYQLEHRIVTPEGAERILLEYAEINWNDQGQPLSMTGSVQDITELRQAEREAQMGSERLKLALTATHLGVWEWNVQADELFWSRECFQIFGVDKFGGTREAFLQFVYPDDVSLVTEIFEQVLTVRKLYKPEFRIVRPDGEIRWVANLGQGIYDKNGNLLRVIGTVQDITRQKQTEASLRESQRMFQQLAESLPQFVWMTDAEGRNTYTSPQYLAYIGDSVSTQRGWGWLEYVHPEDRVGFEQSMQRAKSQGLPHRYEFRLLRHDGVYRWFDSQAIPIRDAYGQIHRWIGTNSDIQEQREIREALRASEERLRLATEAAEIGTWDRDLKSNRLIWSPTLERLMGLEPGSFAGTIEAFLEILHPDDHVVLAAAQQRARQEDGRYRAELRFQLPQGQLRWALVQGQILFDDQGQPERMIGIDLDITERKQSEAELSRLAALVESSDDAIISSDLNGTITSWNKGAAQVFGYTAAEIVGKNLAVLCPHSLQQERVESFAMAKRGERLIQYETVRVRKDGSQFPISVTISPMVNRNGQIIGVSKIGRDITSRKKTEAELRLWADAFTNCAHGIGIGHPKNEQILVCNPAYAKLRGESLEKIAGAPILTSYDPASHLQVRQLIARSDSTGQAQGEVQLLRTDGTNIHVQLDLVSVRDDSGQLRYRVATLQDITERLRAEAGVRLSEERLRLLYRIVSNYKLAYTERIQQLLELGTKQFGLENGVVGQVLNQRYRVTHVVSLNNSLETGFSCPLNHALCEEVLRRNDLLALEHVSSSPWREHIACSTFGTEVYFGVPLQVGQRIYGTLCFASSTPRSVPFSSGDSEFLRLVAEWVGVELTRHEAAEALRRAEERQRLALKAGQMGTWCWYPAEGMVEADETCLHLFGIAPAAFTGHTQQFYAVTHPDDVAEVQRKMFEAYEKREAYRAEYRVIHPDQSVHWLLGMGQGFYRTDGAFLGFNGVVFETTESKQAEEHLRQSESHFRALFESSGVGNVECDAVTGRFIHVNQRMCELIGYSDEELRSRTFSDITYPADLDSTWQAYQQFIAGQVPYYSVEKRYVRQDGSLIWVSIASTLLRDEQGRPWHTVAVVQDITARKRAVEELRESEERFRLLFEHSPVGIRILDYDTMQIVDCNEMGAAMLGYTREEMRQLTVAAYEAKLTEAELEGHLAYLRGGGKLQFETEERTKTGELKHVIVTPTNLRIQGKDYICGYVLDVTELKRTEAALHHETGRLSTIADASPSVIFSFRATPEGRFYYPYVSSAFMDLYGLTAEQAKNQPDLTEEVVHLDDRQDLRASILQSAQTMTRWHHSWRINHPRKGEIWVEGYASPVAEADGGLIWHGILNEITERRRAEAELQRERERLEKIAAVSPSVIHSFHLTADGKASFPYVSPSIMEIYGLPPEEISKNATVVFDLIHEDDRQFVTEQIRESARRMSPFHETWRVNNPRKGEIWIECFSSPVRDAYGSVVWHGILNDVTERKRAEQTLAENERLFRNVFNQQFQYMAILSPEGRVREINDMPLQLSGLGREDYLGKLFWQTPAWKNLAEWQEIWPARLAQAANIEGPVLTEDAYQLPDGSIGYADAATTAVRNEAGAVEYFIIQTTDTTKRKQAEITLLDRERWFRALIEHSTDSICVINQAYRILYLSPAVQFVEGYAPEDLIGRNAADDTHPDDVAYLARILRELENNPGKSVPIVWRRLHKEGYWVWLEGVVTNLLDDPAVCGFVTNYRDITQRRQAEQQLLNSQEELRQLATHLQSVREEERKTVAREIHDELGQQLTGARMNLKWLEQNLLTNPPVTLERLGNTVELIGRTIQTVRRISTSLHPAILDDFGLLAALEWQVNEFQKHTGITCRLVPLVQELELERPRALAVFRICQESLTNIARHANATEAILSLGVEAASLWVRIEDNGQGISPEAQVNRRSLGLISMRERMLSFGGDFTINSAPGEGTTVSVKIPLSLSA